MRRSAALALLASALVAPSLLAGCTATGITELAETPGAEAPSDPELQSFREAIAGHSPTDPEALVAAVESAGFARATIERTREVDSLGAPVTLLQIAVRTDDGCIVGEVGDGDARAVRAAALGGGRCLVGEIVALD